MIPCDLLEKALGPTFPGTMWMTRDSKGIVERGKYFKDAVELESHLMATGLSELHIGAVYAERKKVVGFPIAFDLDLFDYDPVVNACTHRDKPEGAVACRQCVLPQEGQRTCDCPLYADKRSCELCLETIGYPEAQRIEQYLRNERGLSRVQILFSGSKGFHVRCFDPVQWQSSYTRTDIKYNVVNLGVKVDSAVVDDVHHTMRCPFSANRKGGLCLPVDPSKHDWITHKRVTTEEAFKYRSFLTEKRELFRNCVEEELRCQEEATDS